MRASVDANFYDAIPYPSYPRPQAHPRHLEAMACLLGLQPPAIERCRILELGCGTGGNLIPVASSLPKAECVGIELSDVQIDVAQKLIRQASLQNVSLHCMDILDVDESFGTFDYIICHGVYSWVPSEVRSKILQICGRQLNGDGVAFVSYNTHPGWHQRGALRQMLNYHASRFPDDSPAQKVRRAREFLDFLTKSTKPTDSSYGMMLHEQSQLLSSLSDGYLFHEHFERDNEPTWFLDFSQQLEPFGLRYLADADFSSMLPSASFTADSKNLLAEFAPNLLLREQYLDFLRNRALRQSLICHASQRPNYDVRSERLMNLCVASPLMKTDSAEPIDPHTVEIFSNSDGMTVSSSLPIFKAALVSLRAVWPGFLPFDELFAQACARMGMTAIDNNDGQPEDLKQALARSLLTTFASSSRPLVQLVRTPPRMARSLAAMPKASSLARAQAIFDEPVVNARHEIVAVTSADRRILAILDGSNSIAQTVEKVGTMVAEGILTLSTQEANQPVIDPTPEMLEELVLNRLRFFLNAGLLDDEI